MTGQLTAFVVIVAVGVVWLMATRARGAFLVSAVVAGAAFGLFGSDLARLLAGVVTP